MTKLRIGFIGVGGMGQMAHLSNYAQLKDQCEVVALAEPRVRQGELVAQRYGIPEVYDNHMDMLEKAKVDAVVAAQQYRHYPALIPDILQARIPIFTEKPLCLTVEAGRELVALSEKHRTLHMVGYHKRSDPAMEFAKRQVEEWKKSGEVGSLRYIRVTMPPGDWTANADAPLVTDEAYPPMTVEPAPADYTDAQTKHLDMFVNYYIHQVNAIRFFLEEPYRFAFGDRRGILMVGESDSGVTVELEMAPYVTSVGWDESILVGFDTGYVRIDLPAPLVRQQAGKVTVMKDNGNGEQSIHQPMMPHRSAMRNQAINFIAAVRGDRPAPCEAREALEDLIVARDYVDFLIRSYGL